MKDQKSAKEKLSRQLISHVVTFAEDKLTLRENQLLTEILVKNRSFEDLSKKTDLPEVRLIEILEHSIERIGELLKERENHEYQQELSGHPFYTPQERLSPEEIMKNIHSGIKYSKDWPEKYNVLIKDTPLSARSKNICHRAELKTIGELVQVSKYDLLQTHNCGKLSINEIEIYLKGQGLKFNMALSELK